METYLRQYINFAQTDIFEWLPMAEFAANNAVNSSTQVSPFFATRGFHPRITFGPPRPQNRASLKQDQTSKGNDFVSKIESILQTLQTNLAVAQAQQEASSNANRSPAPAYHLSDLVFLSIRNIPSARPVQKLDHKFIRPFKVIEAVNSHSYRLDLPPEFRLIHNVFHTSLLQPSPNDPLPSQTNPPPPPIVFDDNGDVLWAVESILDSRRSPSYGFEYLVKWKGYSEDDASWEPLYSVIRVRPSILEFQRRFPQKPRPTPKERKQAKELIAANDA